jgi:Holliday junction resolvase-like predicted endonuclease
MPVEAVTADKQRRLRTLAMHYLRAHPELGRSAGPRGRPGGRSRPGRENAMRFDIVSVLGKQVEVLQAAF